jgi:hypothetical protein
LGVENSTDRDEVVLSYVSRELVTRRGTAVVSSGGTIVAEAVASIEEKESVGVEDEGPLSSLGEGPIEVVSIAVACVADGHNKASAKTGSGFAHIAAADSRPNAVGALAEAHVSVTFSKNTGVASSWLGRGG